jgi:1-aminocyclopropane-1-carboxylate deaminase/D-cysteine desulfhydrase-like pyridoxal-dependent ACC family enzyme
MIPLFEVYPGLDEKMPRAEIADLPTPVTRVEGLGVADVFVKRDDLCAEVYGGNKVRKLEFFFGHAREAGFETTLTYGCVGSNHALATAIHGSALGLRPLSVLFPQPVARSVRRNLLRHYQTGAVLRHCGSGREGAAATRALFQEEDGRSGRFPMVIPAGGSSPLGVVGFVNAAFELKAQIVAGALPEPDVLYVPSGTMGTCVGLLLGLHAAGLRTHVMAVAVTVAPWTSAERARQLFRASNDYLCACDASFPRIDFPEAQFSLRPGFLGNGYGQYTKAGLDGVRRAGEAGIALEGCYTGKTFAALLEDAAAGQLRGKTVLFWDTYNSRDFSDATVGVDYHELPELFHTYFEQPLQALEAGL